MSRIDSFDPPEANPDVRRASDPPPRGPWGFVADSLKMAWRWLRRMRTALYLLGVLGLLTLLATVVPQEPNVPRTVAAWRAGTEGPGVVVSGLIEVLGGYDVYGSAAFLALLLLLFISLTACLIPRVKAWVRIVRGTRPPRTRYLGSQEHVAVMLTAADPASVHAEARRLLAGDRWRLREPDGARGDHGLPDQVAAEKGHALREGGSLVFHLSFYVLLIGIVLGQLLGFSGQVGIVEGNSFAETAVGYWTYQPGRWWDRDDHRGFVMTLDQFNVDWHRDVRLGGQPKLFLSEVTIREPDGTTYQDTVGGNDPLVVDGMKIHQLDWGYAPRVEVEVDGELLFDGLLTLRRAEGGFYTGAVKVPAADPDVGLEVFFWPYAPEGDDGQPSFTGAPWADAPLMIFQQYRGDLQLTAAQNVNELETAGLETVGGAALRLDGTVEMPDGVTVRFPELRRYVGFQISQRPTAPLLLAGAFLILAGLVPALYAYRRRLWVQAEGDPDGSGRTRVTVAGRAFQRPQAFEVEHQQLTRELADVVDAQLLPPEDPDGGTGRSTRTPTQAVTR